MEKDRQKLLLGVGIVILLGCCAAASVAALMVAGRVYSAFNDESTEPARFAAEDDDASFLRERGLLITAVDPAGPAARSGLRRGDIILSAGGFDTDRASTLQRIVGSLEPGESVELTIASGEEIGSIVVSLGSGESNLGINVLAARPLAPGSGGPVRPPGSAVTPPSPPDPQPEIPDRAPPEIPFDRSRAMAIVGAVIEGGPAEEAGLLAGDLVTGIDEESILSVAELLEALGSHEPGDRIEVKVRRGTETLSFQVRLARHPDDPSRAFLGIELGSSFVHPPLGPTREPDREG